MLDRKGEENRELIFGQAWYDMPIIPAPGRQKQEAQNSKASLECIWRPYGFFCLLDCLFVMSFVHCDGLFLAL